MKAKAILVTGLAMGLLSLGTPSYLRADYPPFTHSNADAANNHEVPPANPPENGGAPGTLSGQSSGSQPIQPQAANCATKLIGMKVVNQSNKDLGTVKDVVFDLPSGQISYVVIEKSSPAEGTGQFAAVRPNSLVTSSDANSLVLNVSKDRFERSRGFSQTSYPNIRPYGTQPVGEEEIFIVTPDQTQ
ncbi:MAG TPA: PRC-barrel domain-containing protein [Verrucomicrobiae bacterium]|nr:PRC-barrel domain-containing protein [Verrucomicrobiae bacterium]